MKKLWVLFLSVASVVLSATEINPTASPSAAAHLSAAQQDLVGLNQKIERLEKNLKKNIGMRISQININTQYLEAAKAAPNNYTKPNSDNSDESDALAEANKNLITITGGRFLADDINSDTEVVDGFSREDLTAAIEARDNAKFIIENKFYSLNSKESEELYLDAKRKLKGIDTYFVPTEEFDGFYRRIFQQILISSFEENFEHYKKALITCNLIEHYYKELAVMDIRKYLLLKDKSGYDTMLREATHIATQDKQVKFLAVKALFYLFSIDNLPKLTESQDPELYNKIEAIKETKNLAQIQQLLRQPIYHPQKEYAHN